MRKLRTLLYLMALMPVLSIAQTASEYEAWKKQTLGEFKQYKDEIDKQFAGFLKQKWKPFDTEKGFVRDTKPKPVLIPVAKPEDEPVEVKKPDAAKKTPEPDVVKLPDLPVIKQPAAVVPIIAPPVPGHKSVRLTFLGYELAVSDSFSSDLGALPNRVTQQSIQKQFDELAQSEYPATLDNLVKVKQRLGLNDWAYISLVRQFSSKLSISDNSQTMVNWFLLLKSGLDTRVAFSAQRIYLLVSTRQNLYDIAFFKFDNQKYYAVSQEKKLPRKLFSYNGKYPKQLNVSNFSPANEINSKPDSQLRRLKFTYQGKQYELEIPYNKNTVAFQASYPQMDIDQYFRSPLNSVTANALISQLQPKLKGLSETEAVNLLLSFVQNAFHYETDGDQFGAENYMFIEETLFYPSSDCEDRSILFAWLVKHLLGLQVVALDFPGHIATAVALKKPAGELINYRRTVYTIADPTYINARAGMKMPQYKNVAPKVISIL